MVFFFYITPPSAVKQPQRLSSKHDSKARACLLLFCCRYFTSLKRWFISYTRAALATRGPRWLHIDHCYRHDLTPHARCVHWPMLQHRAFGATPRDMLFLQQLAWMQTASKTLSVEIKRLHACTVKINLILGLVVFLCISVNLRMNHDILQSVCFMQYAVCTVGICLVFIYHLSYHPNWLVMLLRCLSLSHSLFYLYY